MDLRQLKYFVAVAEEGGFRRAAARLNITQPPLSLQIQALETDLGVNLFDRAGHRIRLTAAGAALLRRARAILETIGDARQEAQRVGRGEVGRLVIGVMSAALLGRLPPILDAFRQAAPGVDVAIDQRSPKNQIAAIAAGEIDVGLLALSPGIRLEHNGVVLASEPLWQEELLAAVCHGFRLPDQPKISLSVLAKERFVSIGESPEIGYHQQLAQICSKAGFVPDVRYVTHQLPVALTLIAAGYGVGLMPACMAETWSPLAQFRRLEAPESIVVSIIWRQQETAPAVDLFRQLIARKMAGRYFRIASTISSNGRLPRQRDKMG